jgi:uncharacterized protein YabE (DUF348 family)
MKISINSDTGLRLAKLTAVIVACLVLATSLVYGWMEKDIVISDDGEKIAIKTFKNTVEDALNDIAIEVGPYDKMSISMTEKLKDGLSISIQRAKKISIKTKDNSIFIFSTADTVENVLKEAEILIGSKDRVEPGMSSKLQQDMQINVIRVEEKLASEKVQIEFANEVKKIDSLAKGLVNVVQKGQQGQKEVTIKTVYEDGKEVSKKIVSEKIIKKPVNGIIEEGVKTTLVTSRGQINFTRVINMSSTAYDASFESCGKTPDHPQYGITYSGVKVRPGIVAVDPRVIPLGTWLYVEGYGEALAADIGGAIKGNRIDLFYESSKVVDRYGRKSVKVYVLDKPKYKF